ncbi:hypothetical protein [Kribbella jejuensis]|uniref:DUF4333 domain-containing protein n=1 Tax=Kribbella jejuensis TaxID=236068 RepID=A0A542EB85_9ACTN|nr:hypothetical protein [Kribbella jejuensis]TQJ12603.1 hypothetical protein FB475_5551 [Kribbella jejuensis]
MLLTGDRRRSGLAAFGVLVLGVLLLSACSDSQPDASPSTSAGSSGPSSPAVGSPIPTASTPVLTPLPTPSKPWPMPAVTGAPADDAALAERITFAISKQTQIAAGRAAKTTVKCPGIDTVETAGQHSLDCTVTYSGKSFTGKLTVDAKQYSASYKFTSAQVAIVRAKVIDAVLRTAAGASKVTCDMDEIGIVVPDGPPIGCDVTTTANAVQPYKASVTGNGQVHVEKA